MDLVKFDGLDYSGILVKTSNKEFRVVTEDKLSELSHKLSEMDRVASIFSKTNSQTSASLMTLTMLDTTPLRMIHQIAAQIEKKRGALKENIFRLENNKIKLEKLRHELETNKDIESGRDLNDFDVKEKDLELDQINAGILDATSYIEAAIKEIGAYLDRYEDILESHNIPKDWDEKDFEEAEIKHHITAAFREALKDRMNGPTNHGTCEYFEQWGIEPMLAYALVEQFIRNTQQKMMQEKEITIKDRYQFYEDMYNRFKDNYKHAMERIGIKSLYYEKWLLTSPK